MVDGMPDKKVALITGISGQDGYYLSRLLLDLGYQVIGTSRKSSNLSQNNIFDNIIIVNTDYSLVSLKEIISKYQPVIRIRPLTLDNRLIERALNLSVSQDELQLLRKIKEKFDPEGRLNPGLLI